MDRCNDGEPTVATTEAVPPTTIQPEVEDPYFCNDKHDMLYSHPDCSKYYHCYNSGSQIIGQCPASTMFSQPIQACDWPANVDCGAIPATTDVNTQPPQTTTEETVPTTDATTDAGPTGTAPPEASNKVIVCYFTNWAQYRNGAGKQVPTDLPSKLCTHYVYAFAKIPTGQNILYPYEWNDISALYPAMMNLKTKNPKLKVTLAVGGWTHGSLPFTLMVATKQSRLEFIKNSIKFLRTHNFDGLDLDWEYPAKRGSPDIDRERYNLYRIIYTSF